jgi:NAD(P)-dependent dehydrogenase (short-subunit alcohol dehydrogenase family)
VWILGSRQETVAAALAGVPGLAGGAACDVADESEVERALAEVRDGMGGVDVAFVNAGIDGEGKGVMELSASHFRRVLEVNVLGAFLVARGVARLMPEGGSIVVNASVNAMRAEPDFADYNASKAAVASLAQTMALDLAERRIAVTAICPGYVRTGMTERYLDDPDTASEILAHIPVRRFGSPDEVAALVNFLATEEAAYMTGALIPIDGGRNV